MSFVPSAGTSHAASLPANACLTVTRSGVSPIALLPADAAGESLVSRSVSGCMIVFQRGSRSWMGTTAAHPARPSAATIGSFAATVTIAAAASGAPRMNDPRDRNVRRDIDAGDDGRRHDRRPHLAGRPRGAVVRPCGEHVAVQDPAPMRVEASGVRACECLAHHVFVDSRIPESRAWNESMRVARQRHFSTGGILFRLFWQLAHEGGANSQMRGPGMRTAARRFLFRLYQPAAIAAE